MSPDASVGVHVGNHVHHSPAQHLPRHRVLIVQEPADETLHPPGRHGLARVLPPKDPHHPLGAPVARPRRKRRPRSLHRRLILRGLPRERRLGRPRPGLAEPEAIQRPAVEGVAQRDVRDVWMGRGGRDEVEVPLVIVRDKVREVHAVARYGVHVDDQLAVDVRRGLDPAPVLPVRGRERLVVAPPVGVRCVTRVLDDDAQRAAARAGDPEVEPLEVRPAVRLREGFLAHAHGERVWRGGDELAVAGVERRAEAVRRAIGGAERHGHGARGDRRRRAGRGRTEGAAGGGERADARQGGAHERAAVHGRRGSPRACTCGGWPSGLFPKKMTRTRNPRSFSRASTEVKTSAPRAHVGVDERCPLARRAHPIVVRVRRAAAVPSRRPSRRARHHGDGVRRGG